MTVRQFVSLVMDTEVLVRDRNTGKYINERTMEKEYLDKEVCGVYARRHGLRKDERVQLVVMAR